MISEVRFARWEKVVWVCVVIDILHQRTAFVCFIVWQETRESCHRNVNISLAEEVEGVSFS